jgi:nicotinate-nucleotide adenylyltransferase
VSEPRRIGVFGGTFDPIHEAHLSIARAALAQARLDDVLFVVSAAPPHKRHAVHAPAEDRYAMVAAALAGLNEPRFHASRVEIDRPGPSYTADTLRELQAQYPGATLYLIVGADALVDLPRWRDPEGILQRAKLLVMPRPGVELGEAPGLAGRYQLLQFEETPLSSTDVRARAASGAPLTGLVPDAAAAVLNTKGLYRGAASEDT